MEKQALNISIERIKKSKIESVDFDNLSFGRVFTDHMLVCEYTNGSWRQAIIKPFQNLSLSPAAKVFHYGQAIFEGMKAYRDADNRIFLFRPLDNWKRMNSSAIRMAMPEIPKEYFMEGLQTLLRLDRNWVPNTIGSALYIRPFMFASGAGFHASPAEDYTFIIALAPSGSYFSGDLRVRIEQKYSRSANGGVGYAKAGGNYAGQFYPTQLAIENGYQQVIWTDDNTHENIEEAGAMNIFVRIEDILITAPTSDRILDGITRKSVIALAAHLNIPVEVRPLKVAEIIHAAKGGSLKEMFGTGTAAVISPISGFGFEGKNYTLALQNDAYAALLKKHIIDIQYNLSTDPFNWRYEVEE